MLWRPKSGTSSKEILLRELLFEFCEIFQKSCSIVEPPVDSCLFNLNDEKQNKRFNYLMPLVSFTYTLKTSKPGLLMFSGGAEKEQ